MKLCPCKRKFIREEVESIACYDSCTEAITKIVESDCLCKPGNSSCSEIPNNSKHKLLGTELEYTVVECSKCQFAFKTYTGQKVCSECTKDEPQSPCEHEWRQVERRVRISEMMESYETYPLWGCYKEGCGLVTCKNPSGSSINQNQSVST